MIVSFFSRTDKLTFYFAFKHGVQKLSRGKGKRRSSIFYRPEGRKANRIASAWSSRLYVKETWVCVCFTWALIATLFLWSAYLLMSLQAASLTINNGRYLIITVYLADID